MKPNTNLLIEKIVAQCRLVVEALGEKFLPGVSRADLVHDIAAMMHSNDLRSVTLEIVRATQVIAGAVWKFTGKTLVIAPRGFDRAEGLELPVLTGGDAAPRFSLERGGNDAGYRHQLRLNWGEAERFARAGGSSFGSEHVLKTTGGRAAAEIFVADAERRELRVYKAGALDFAFAQTTDRKLGDIYLHTDYASPGLRFRCGQRLSAILISTPAGLQAREIRRV